MPVTTTVQVSFQGASANATLTAELDTREDGYNGGRSSFSFGDEPVILVRRSSNVQVDAIKTNVGTVAAFASGFTSEEEFLSFVQSKSASTGKPISSGFSSQWYGKNLGPVRVQNVNEVVLTTPGKNEDVGVLGVAYQSAFDAYRLSGVPSKLNGKSNFNVVVVFIGSLIEEP